MERLKELQAQIEQLQREQAEERERVKAEHLSHLKDLLDNGIITREDVLALLPKTAPKDTRVRSKGVLPPKYRDPVSGATWSGKGPVPHWIADKNREDFLIEPAQ